MIKILFFQCCRSGKVSECWNSTTCGSKGNSTQCVRDSNRCNVWENKGKLMKIKLRCSNIYFIWLCTCAVVSLTFLGINFHGMSKITISRIHTFMVNVPVSTIFYYTPGIHFNEHIWFRGSINWWSKCIVFWCIIRHCNRLCLGIWRWWIQNQKYVMHANFQQWKENHWCYSTSQQAERSTI